MTRSPALDYLPLFTRLHGRPCLVVGAGAVGLRKARALLSAGALVTVVAPEACEGVRGLADSRHLEWRREAFRPEHVDGAFLVISATGDPEVDDAVFRAANAANRPVNVVDDQERCSFIFPSIVDRSPVVVAVSTGGASPVLARLIRERLEALLPTSLGQLAALAGRWRGRVKRRLGSLSRRRRLWERVLDGEVADLVHAGRHIEAERAMGRALAAAEKDGPPPGRVWLVGAGPGDPGLLTLRAHQVMQQADVILHDRLVSPEVLALARRDAELVEVGKSAGRASHGQEEINGLLLAHARAGRRVCRLKGGDPFVFGRGGEELEALAAAGIGYEVVPGVTAAVGCAAYAGLPLTHRDHSAAVTLVTAHRREAVESLDWTQLARPGHTLAVYMGVGQVASIRERLVGHGRDPATPAVFVENGSTPRQRVVHTTLGTMAADAERYRVVSPAMLFIGEVAALARQLGWYGEAASLEAAEILRGLPRAADAQPGGAAVAAGAGVSPGPDAGLPADPASAGGGSPAEETAPHRVAAAC